MSAFARSRTGCFAVVSLIVELGWAVNGALAAAVVKFSSDEIGASPPRSDTRGSALEVVEVASLDRRVIHRASGKMEAPVN